MTPEEKEQAKLLNQMQDKLAEGLSKLLRSIKGKEDRINALKHQKKEPTIDILRRIDRIAKENEDYETCAALKEYSEQKGMKL